ncbi:MAG: hypothetical protein MJ010_08915 [Paludibacteraceae bacterium]|nr:hypothetical protein [Paludibacteraceae bacterium]
MKTLKFISIALAGALLVLSACKKDNGNEPESVFKVTPTELSFTKDGGTQELTLKVSNSWKAEVDAEWCTLSAYKGDKDAFIDVTAEASTSEKETTAVIKFTDTRGNTASVTVKRAGTGDKPGPTPTEQVTDVCGNTYPVVKIGEQYWMAENLKCNKYATKSEAYNASWLTNNTVPTSEIYTDTPYYTDASDKSKWYSSEYAGNLTDAQVKKLGYLYNWAAAVGVADGYDYGTKPFSGKRQGICPNGWHIPTSAEWQTLQDYIEKTDGKGTYTAGKHLKTTSGWYNGDSYYKPGLDTYGFAALPAGSAYGSRVDDVGGSTDFWTATPYESYCSIAYFRGLYYYDDTLYEFNNGKYYGRSVRCLRD